MKKKALAWLPALFCAFFALLFASTSSPLYAANFWTDTNAYFTIGRSILRGLMPYRDLFDHKGPLLYVIFAAGAFISSESFTGVFVMEVLSLTVFLHETQRLALEGGSRTSAFVVLPLLAILTCCTKAFTLGGSAEEFCLPFLAGGILWARRTMRQEIPKERGRAAALFGACTAAVFLIKYTVCGLFFGLGLCAVLCLLFRHGVKETLKDIGCMAAGFFAPVLLTALLLLGCGILTECVQVYFIDNLFSYSGTPMSLTGHIWNALAYLRTQSQANPTMAALTVVAMASGILDALSEHCKGAFFDAMALPMGAGLLLLTCYWGEMAHPYYALVFAATAASGLAGLAVLPGKLIRGRSTAYMGAILTAVLCVLLIPLTVRHTAAAPLRSVVREEMPQVLFAEEMKKRSDNPTLFDYCSLDQGFYFASGLTPVCRFFTDSNLDTAEKREAIAQYLTDAVPEFVVTVWKEPGENYEPIMTATGVFDLNDRRTYTLWQRKK